MDAVLSCDREKLSLILFNKLYAVRDDGLCCLLLRIIIIEVKFQFVRSLQSWYRFNIS